MISPRIVLVLRACSVTVYVFSAIAIATVLKRFFINIFCETCDTHVETSNRLIPCSRLNNSFHESLKSLSKSLISLEYRQPTINLIEVANPEVRPGGSWTPAQCDPVARIAILVPYREREVQLRQFLAYIHPYLQAKHLEYRIYLIQQTNSSKFNRGRLLNIGFSHASKDADYDCYICHDIDRLPVSIETPYECAVRPLQLGVLQQFRNPAVGGGWLEYTFPLGYVGGVTAMTGSHFRKINGFSNQFFGWGGEDDDLRHRFKYYGLNYTRVPVKMGKFRHLTHKQEKKNPLRVSLMISGRKKFMRDGLSNLQYTRVDYKLKKLYTLITADFQPQGVPMEHKKGT